jgi:hypothetical protein
MIIKSPVDFFMSRPLRIEYPDAWHHVMNRGSRGEEIYTERNDYERLGVQGQIVDKCVGWIESLG